MSIVTAARDARSLIRGDGANEDVPGTYGEIAGHINSALQVYKGAQEGWGFIKTHFGYTIAVTSDDDLYYPLQRWLTNAIPKRKRRASVAQVSWSGSESLRVKHDGGREQFVKIGDSFISVIVKTAEATDPKKGLSYTFGSRDPERVVMTAFSQKGRDAIEKLLEDLARSVINRDDDPVLHIWSKDGWQWSGRLQGRKLETIALPLGQLDRIVASLDEFASREQRYSDLGIPWHHGIILYGPAGTGKTSIARGIATYAGKDLYYLGLSSIENDEALFSAISRIRRGSILLLEDIETVRAATDTQNENETGITQGGLRNALDGVMTPHGLVTIASTNELDAIDDIIIRSGRFDLFEEISYADIDVVKQIFMTAFGMVYMGRWDRKGVSPAQVVGAIKPHLDDMTAANQAIMALNNGTLEVEIHDTKLRATTSSSPSVAGSNEDAKSDCDDVAG